MVVALLIIGFVDFSTGFQIRLLPFYCGPIFIVAWFCEKRLGIFIACIAAIDLADG